MFPNRHLNAQIASRQYVGSPQRELVFIVTARTLQAFYMHAALCRLARFPRVKIIPIVSEPQNVSPAIRSGASHRAQPVMDREASGLGLRRWPANTPHTSNDSWDLSRRASATTTSMSRCVRSRGS